MEAAEGGCLSYNASLDPVTRSITLMMQREEHYKQPSFI